MYALAWVACAWNWLLPLSAAFVNYGALGPKAFAQQTTPTSTGLAAWTNASLNLSPSNPLVTLDYGTEVAGFPFFNVSAVSGLVQIEVKYTEEFRGLLRPYSDGPWTFSNGLSNTFRLEQFNITRTGYVESFFVQGGQRWQSVRLITNGTVTLESVGLRLTSPSIAPNELPGHLSMNNEAYERIFDLGGQCVRAACVDAGNSPSTWELTEDGAYIRGQASAQLVLGVGASNYTLEFDVKIIRGGAGWRIAAAVQPLGPYFVLTSEYPEHNTFANTNTSLLPPNTLVFNSGWSLINQTTLLTPENQYFVLNRTIKENAWYHLSTAIEATGYRTRLEGEDLVFVPLPPPVAPSFFGTPSRYEGTWGFGGMQD